MITNHTGGQGRQVVGPRVEEAFFQAVWWSGPLLAWLCHYRWQGADLILEGADTSWFNYCFSMFFVCICVLLSCLFMLYIVYRCMMALDSIDSMDFKPDVIRSKCKPTKTNKLISVNKSVDELYVFFLCSLSDCHPTQMSLRSEVRSRVGVLSCLLFCGLAAALMWKEQRLSGV